MKQVIIDIHEPQELDGFLLQRGVQVIRKRLVPGDILVGGVLIERKTLHDFAASLKQQRLFEQLYRLQQTFMDCLLILETPTEKFSAKLLFLLAKIQIDMKIPLFFSHSLEETATIVASLVQRKPYLPSASVQYYPRSWPLKECMKKMLMQIPGIGRKTAEELLFYFKTIQTIANASRKELQAAGLGKKRSKIVNEFFTSEFENTQDSTKQFLTTQ